MQRNIMHMEYTEKYLEYRKSLGNEKGEIEMTPQVELFLKMYLKMERAGALDGLVGQEVVDAVGKAIELFADEVRNDEENTTAHYNRQRRL